MDGQRTVFYAWQSDRDNTVCRYFIREAAKKAVKRIAKGRLQNAPSLDHDTNNITGTPHIAQVIQKKIKRCGVFLADLTAVASYTASDGRPKQTPNPNVMVELGLAIRAVGWERIVLVMNTAFGEPDDLPFDLKHHSFPIQYRLAPDGDRKAIFDELAERLHDKIKPIFGSGIIETAEANRSLMSVTINVMPQNHVRYLCVDVTNKGTTLNHVHAVLEWGNHGPVDFKFLGTQPEPFAAHFSGRFVVYNDEPHQANAVLVVLPPEQVIITVYSGVRVIAKLPATQWLKQLEDFRQANPSLPAKPADPETRRVSIPDWINSYRGRW